jgi:ATP-dependent DNA helicase RecG
LPSKGTTGEAADSAATLRNVLRLEQQRGHDDRAVVGGLSALMARIGPPAELSGDLLERIRHYRDQTEPERSETVAAALDILDRLATGGGPGSVTLPRNLPADFRNQPPDLPSRGPRTTRAAIVPPAPKGPRPLDPRAPVASMPAVGATRVKRLAALGVTTLGDLRFHLPNRYVFYPPPEAASALGFQHLASFEGLVTRVEVTHLPHRRLRIAATLSDSTGSVGAVWIRSGFAPPGIRQGTRLAVSGELVRYGRQTYFENPEYEPASDPPLNTRGITPVYPLTAGLSQPFMRGLVRRAVDGLPPVEEWLPEWLRSEEDLIPRNKSILELHRPTSEARLAAAQHRYAFDELFALQILVLQRRLEHQALKSNPIQVPWSLLAELRQRLPFALTGDQQRALSEILADVAHDRPMLRLLQGEVGSGKTVVAAMAMLAGVASGGQAALMAPTEILAEQHLRTLTDLFGGTRPALEAALGRPVRVALLSGALSRADRQRTLAAIASGEVDVVVGTQAIIQSDVEFKRLLLAVVDEQHRFGVNQRVAVRQKGESPHLLVMTATPIPRTMALTIYGDLDVSMIDELPAGRQPVQTELLRPLGRNTAHQAIRAAVADGRQAFVICPLVEGSPSVEARAATEEYERLQEGDLAGLRLALLHGRMRPADKDQVMRDFAEHRSDVLVSTSVVEVGIDVPNATVMVVEGAERFGLAQLHQFRGRVARGIEAGQCFLIAGSETPEALERLAAVVQSTNGLELAEEDLRIRGPGEYAGLRQSGFPALRIAQITDLEFVQQVREAAGRLLQEDPALQHPEHRTLAEAVRAAGESAGEVN